MNQLDIKKIGFRWKGVYSSSVAYERGDVVLKQDGIAYVNTSESSIPDWSIFAKGQFNYPSSVGSLIAYGFDPSVKSLTGLTGQDLRVSTNGQSLEFTFSNERRSSGISSLAETQLGQGSEAGGGWSHMAAVMTDGSVMAWGRNDKGQLGLATTTAATTTFTYFPSKVAFPPNTPPIYKISVGVWENFAIDVTGGLWVWGNNSNGFLGIGENAPTTVLLPTKVNGYGDLPSTAKVTDVVIRSGKTSESYINSAYALIRTSDGRVYHTGARYYGVAGDGLGRAAGSIIHNKTPKLVLISNEVNIVKMIVPDINPSIGGVSALIDSAGQLYLAGHYQSTGTVSDPVFGQTGTYNYVDGIVGGRHTDMVDNFSIHRLWKPSTTKPVKSFAGSSNGTQHRYIITHQNGQITVYGNGGVTNGNINPHPSGISGWIPTLDERISDVREAYPVISFTGSDSVNLAAQIVLKNDGSIHYIGKTPNAIKRIFNTSFATTGAEAAKLSWSQALFFGNDNKKIWFMGYSGTTTNDLIIAVLKNDGRVIGAGNAQSGWIGCGFSNADIGAITDIADPHTCRIRKKITNVTFASTSTPDGLGAFYTDEDGVVYSAGMKVDNRLGTGHGGIPFQNPQPIFLV